MTDTKRLGVCAPRGFVASGHASGIKQNGKLDTSVIFSKTPCSAAGVFTTNKVQSAAVQLSKRHITSGKAQAVVMTSGNANAATGEEGVRTVEEMCLAVAEKLNIPQNAVLAAQTGLIGIPLNREIAVKGCRRAADRRRRRSRAPASSRPRPWRAPAHRRSCRSRPWAGIPGR